MCKKGAQLLATGLYVKHVLEHLKTGGKGGLITLIVCLFAGLQANVMVPVTHGHVPSARMEMKVKADSALRFALANRWSRSTGSSFNASELRSSTMPVGLLDVIGGANATRSSAARTVKAEDQ
jgi:hypothetical protein